MGKIKTALNILKKGQKDELKLALLKQIGFLLPDKLFLSIRYRLIFGRNLDLSDPKTFSEKIQWLKLYDRKPIYTTMVDKSLVKNYVSEIIGSQFIIPTLGVWDSPDDIDFEKLPNQFVLKTTHGGGNAGVVICKDKSVFDKRSAVKKLKSSIKQDVYRDLREWPYKNVKKRILAEEYKVDLSTGELRDYKFFCFNGMVKALFIATERQFKDGDVKFDFFDCDFNHLSLKQGHENADITPEKPQNFELMLKLASKLSVGIPQVRVDFYEANGNVYFGEITFSHFSGMQPFVPDKWDYIFGSWIQLPSKSYE